MLIANMLIFASLLLPIYLLLPESLLKLLPVMYLMFLPLLSILRMLMFLLPLASHKWHSCCWRFRCDSPVLLLASPLFLVFSPCLASL